MNSQKRPKREVKKTRRSKYTPEFKAECRSDIEVQGLTLEQVAQKRGIPRATILSWAYGNSEDKWVKNKYQQELQSDIARVNLEKFAKINCAMDDVCQRIKEGIFLSDSTVEKIIISLKSLIENGESDDRRKELIAWCRQFLSDKKIESDYIDTFLRMVGGYAPDKKELSGRGGGPIDVQIRFAKMNEAELTQKIEEQLTKLKRVGIKLKPR